MVTRAKALWRTLSQSLGFVPGLIVAGFAVVGIVLVEVDGRTNLDGVDYVFQGDGSAARTVLSVIAGSLITVAGLTFSITMVVLQLASSQFSPRVLRTFFGDRVTQVTIGTYVGTFLYSLLVLRAVGAFGDTGFVPRLSVTLATLFGIVAVVLLVVFLNHVSQMIQVSHVTAAIAHDTLTRADVLYPDDLGEPDDDSEAAELLCEWRESPPGTVTPSRPGYVQRVGTEDLPSGLAGRLERLAVLVRPGDFVGAETAVVEVWPREAARECEDALRALVTVGSERDLHQDVGFGVRQLGDTALKAMSPGINDPMTAVTCVSYLRSILVRLTRRARPRSVRRLPGQELTVIVTQVRYAEYFEVFRQLNRYLDGDTWVAGEMLEALGECAAAARDCGAADRLRVVRTVAAEIAGRAREEAGSDADRETVARLMGAIDEVARAAGAA